MTVNRRLAALGPILLDMLAPVVSFYVLHFLFGVGPALALTAGAVVAGLRGAYRAVSERRIDAFPLMMMVLLAVSVTLVFLTGDPRLVLAKSAVTPIAGGLYGLVTSLFGRTVLYDVLTPFVTRGDPGLARRWNAAWDTDPGFVRRIRQLNVLWGIGFILGGTARIVVVYSVPLEIGVLAGLVPTVLMVGGLVLITWLGRRPLTAVLRPARPVAELPLAA
jgi:intracellular septation protein A